MRRVGVFALSVLAIAAVVAGCSQPDTSEIESPPRLPVVTESAGGITETLSIPSAELTAAAPCVATLTVTNGSQETTQVPMWIGVRITDRLGTVVYETPRIRHPVGFDTLYPGSSRAYPMRFTVPPPGTYILHGSAVGVLERGVTFESLLP